MDVREFNYLFYRDWNNTGGLVTPSTAAKLLGLSTGRISQIWEERKLRKYIYSDPSKPLLSLNDIKSIQSEKYDKLSTEARDIIDKEQAEWEIAYEKWLKEIANQEDIEPPKSYEEEIGEEIDEYRRYMNKKIGKK